MNKKTYAITILLLCISNLFAENYLISSAIIYKDSIWQKINYNYNSDKKIIKTTIFESLDKVEWKNHTYSTYTYTNGAVSEICDYTWDSNSWSLSQRQTFEYYGNNLSSHTIAYNNIQEISTYEYNDSITIAKHEHINNQSRESYIITTQKTRNNKLYQVKTFSLSTQNDTLFSQITTFDYTATTTTSTTCEKINGQYLPTTKTVTTHTPQTDIEIQYEYTENNWIPIAKQTYYYDNANRLIEELYQIWENNFWLSNYKRIYSYDQNGAILSSAVLTLQYKEWELLYQINYDYNNQLANAFIEQSFWSETNQTYNDFISINGNNTHPFILCNQIQIEYSDIITDIPINIVPIEVYPNPSMSGVVFISTDLHIYQVMVYNSNGILVYADNYNGPINLSHLNCGLYFIHITTNDGSYTFKQIIANN